MIFGGEQRASKQKAGAPIVEYLADAAAVEFTRNPTALIRALGSACFSQYPRQVGHDPSRAIDAVIGRGLVQEAEDRLLDHLIVELPVRLDLKRE